MGKTQETLILEKNILSKVYKQGVFCCFEVTIGWFGKERVDFMTYDTKGIWRCYEVKVSKSDFNSKSKHTFIGHYNYYVMPSSLYEKVKDRIPAHVGVWLDGKILVKNPKKQPLMADEQTLKDSMIRSLSRDAMKLYKSKDGDLISRYKKEIHYLEDRLTDQSMRHAEFVGKVYEKYGYEAVEELRKGTNNGRQTL